jgi:hypothetical protein
MSVVQTALDAVALLARRYAFIEVAALLAAGAGGEALAMRDVATLQQLCAFGHRLLALDAEDFGVADAVVGSNLEHDIADREHGDAVPRKLVERSVECRMPQSASEQHRGALASLRPVYRLLLEVVQVRFARREPMGVITATHIASEYAPLLVWERVLGHSGDPKRLPRNVGGVGSAWGDAEDRGCPHTKTQKSAAKRALTVARENAEGWQSYLDRQHSSVSRALAVCGADCHRKCTVYTGLSPQDQATVTAGSRIALALNDSAILRLRHSAPVGHAFGVPSEAELFEAWARTRASLSRLVPLMARDDGYPLPGFTALISALAGEPMTPDTLVADTAAAISAVLAKAAPTRA